MSISALFAMEITPREPVLETVEGKPLLCAQETAMLHSWRGVGKTYTALGLAPQLFAAAINALGDAAPAYARPRRVPPAYIDAPATESPPARPMGTGDGSAPGMGGGTGGGGKSRPHRRSRAHRHPLD